MPECGNCGYKGLKDEFAYISPAGEGVGPMSLRKCPQCGDLVTCDEIEEADLMAEEKRKQARLIAGQLEKAVEVGNSALAQSLLKEMITINRFLQIDGIRLFIKQMKKKIADL